MEARLDPVGDDPCAIAERRRRSGARDPKRKQQADAVRPAEVQVLADDGFEEVAALDGPIEDLGQTDFQLADREAMVIAGRTFGRGHWPRQVT